MKILFKIIIPFILLTCLATGCTQQANQNNPEPSVIDNISENSIFTNINESLIDGTSAMNVIKELSSEKYLGRLIGTKGNELAVDYIVNSFNEIGLINPQGLENYKQFFTQKTIITQNKPTLSIMGSNDEVIKDFDFITDFKPRKIFSNTKIKGSVSSDIYVIDNKKKFYNTDEIDNKILMISKNIVDQYKFVGVVEKIFKIDAQINGVIMNYDNRKEGVYPISRYVRENIEYNNENGPIILYTINDVYEDIINSANKGNKVKISVDYSFKDVTIPNVIGIIPGSDEKLKDEFIIIGAHLDHVGDNKNGTFNPGAYDNASGVSTLLEVAKVLNENQIKPKKSIMFIAFNGEEEGLYGSNYYVENPLYPLDNSTLINLDCVGANSDVALEIAFASNNSKELVEEISVIADEMSIDYKKVIDSSGDHSPFDEKGIKSVMLLDWDDKYLHTIKDTVENYISEDRLKQTIKLVLYYIDKNAF